MSNHDPPPVVRFLEFQKGLAQLLHCRNPPDLKQVLHENSHITCSDTAHYRHLAAKTLGKAGYPVATIQQMLRHESENTTERYLHRLGFDLDGLRTAVETFSQRGKGKVLEFTNSKAPAMCRSPRAEN